MYTVYTLTSPKDVFPREDIALVIVKNWYMFKVYSDNIASIKRYIQYINSIFDNAFNILDIDIISYEVPDNVNYDSGYMSDYINEKYNLRDDDILTFEMHLIVEEEFNTVLDKTVEIMANDFGYDDPTSTMQSYVIRDLILVSTMAAMIGYFRDIDFGLLMMGLWKSVSRMIKSPAVGSPVFDASVSELYESKLICTPYLRMLQLKNFVCRTEGKGWLAEYGEGMGVNDGYLCD